MKHYLVIFDSQSHEWTASGSKYILEKSIIDAENEEEAINKFFKKAIEDECFDEEEDEDEIREYIKKNFTCENISVVELVSPKVFVKGT